MTPESYRKQSAQGLHYHHAVELGGFVTRNQSAGGLHFLQPNDCALLGAEVAFCAALASSHRLPQARSAVNKQELLLKSRQSVGGIVNSQETQPCLLPLRLHSAVPEDTYSPIL